jgi:hypothetical protein
MTEAIGLSAGEQSLPVGSMLELVDRPGPETTTTGPPVGDPVVDQRPPVSRRWP